MITSYGIIVFTVLDGKKLFLIGKRPDSLEYLDMFNSRCPIEKVSMYVKMCTPFERYKLLKYQNDFEKIYYDSFHLYRSYDEVKRRWEKIKPIILKTLEEGGKINTGRPMYILPKGRKKQGESPEDAALREFEEETRIDTRLLQKVQYPTYVDTFIGSDDKSYKTIYFVYKTYKAWMPQKIKTKSLLPERQWSISYELSTLLWVTVDEAKKYLNGNLIKILENI
jgi:8-oxo-dGTP pyrophosphatase MutT (NUDIX family)